ncbi:MAG: antibiotic biosynthesis monooxygenase [Rhodospirillaceae bacterium]|nr:antibiotic biosynthesis monooxygenase [Rhodospirillaceae bacterium]|tara:strand:+ start:134 stop:436 length:303 start_codon:yes stop_codon:yes gene_type:complete
MFVITVNFLVKKQAVDKFKPLMMENAQASLAKESGCRQFDVCFDPEDDRKCFLYEVYDDREAFDAHLLTTHFKRFDDAVAPMLEAKEVKVLKLVQGATIS